MKKLTKIKIFVLAFMVSFVGLGAYTLYAHVFANTFTIPEVDAVAYQSDLTLDDVDIPQNNADGSWAWTEPTTSLSGATCGVSVTYGAIFTITDAGDYDKYSSETGYDNGEITTSIPVTVKKADLVANTDYVIPTDLTCTYDKTKTLDDITLGTGFSWDDATTVPTCDVQSYPGKFTPTDTDHYNVANIQIPVDVSKCELDDSDIVCPTFAANNVYDPDKTLADYSIPSDASEYGKFTWADASIVPTVSVDEYDIVFTATGSAVVNYDYSQITDWNNTTNSLAMKATLNITKKTVSTVASPTVTPVIYAPDLLLSSVNLSGKWAWSTEDASTELSAGTTNYTCELEVDDDNYDYSSVSGYADGVISREVAVKVNKAVVSVLTPTCSAITYDPDTSLDDITLPTGWEWSTPDTVPTVNTSSYEATYDIADDANYDYSLVPGYNQSAQDPKIVRNISLQVKKATPSCEVPTVDAIAYEKDKTLANYTFDDDNWSWKEPTTAIVLGTHSYKAVFTPDDTDNYSVVEANVSVYVYEEREELVPDVTESVISGLTEDKDYDIGTKFTITVSGAGMDNTTPIPGDVRYVPISWSVNPSGTWTSAPYVAEFTLNNKGNYTFTVSYREEMFSDTSLSWAATGDTTTTETTFSVGEDSSSSTTDKDDDSDTTKKTSTTKTNTNKNNSSTTTAPKTGDQTPVELMIIILACATAGFVGVLVFSKSKKKKA